MRNKLSRSWLITIIISALSCVFAAFCGLSIAGMTQSASDQEESLSSEEKESSESIKEDPSDSSQATEPSSEKESSSSKKESSSEKDDPKETEPDETEPEETEPEETESVETESETPAEPSETPAPSGAFRVPSDEELNAIAAEYSADLQYYYSSTVTDAANRPLCCTDFEQQLKQKFDNVIIYTGQDNTVALTFLLTLEYDGNTSKILDILAANNVKAVFYTNLNYSELNPDIIIRIISEGHTLGSLGASIPEGGLPAVGLAEQAAQIAAFHNYIAEHYNYHMDKLFYAYDNFSEQSIAVAKACGYKVCFYSINYSDYDHNADINPDSFLLNLEERLHGGAVYSLHTTNSATVILMPGLIKYIQDQGYTLTAM